MGTDSRSALIRAVITVFTLLSHRPIRQVIFWSRPLRSRYAARSPGIHRRIDGWALMQRSFEHLPLPDGSELCLTVAAPESAVRGGIVVMPEARGVTDAVWRLAE